MRSYYYKRKKLLSHLFNLVEELENAIINEFLNILKV